MAESVEGQEQGVNRKTRQRSPSYPFLSLSVALERADVLMKRDGKAVIPRLSAIQAWGFRLKSSYAAQTIAALRSYGLIEFVGTGTLKLTARALLLLIAPKDSAERLAEIQKAALTPSLFAQTWKTYGRDLPSDGTLAMTLVLNGGFPNEATANDFVGKYRETLRFAGLLESGSLSAADSSPDAGAEEPPEVLMSANPSGAAVVASPLSPSSRPAVTPAAQGYRQDVFTLPEGDAALRWPEGLSKESFEEFQGWLELVVRKAARAAGVEHPKKK